MMCCPAWVSNYYQNNITIYSQHSKQTMQRSDIRVSVTSLKLIQQKFLPSEVDPMITSLQYQLEVVDQSQLLYSIHSSR